MDSWLQPIDDATVKDSFTMKTLRVSFGLVTMSRLLLIIVLALLPRIAPAQSDAKPDRCEYQKTWENPETFQGPSITVDQIQQCLREKKLIKNHHIVFEDYVKAWENASKEKADYTLPLLIEGGMLQAKTPYNRENPKGGIQLWKFRDPAVTETSDMPEEQWKALGIKKKDEPIDLIRAVISWTEVVLDSALFELGANRAIFSKEAIFEETQFRKEVAFEGIQFSRADFRRAQFNNKVNFRRAQFRNRALFIDARFRKDTNFGWAQFGRVAFFGGAQFSQAANFGSAQFSQEAKFSGVKFIKEVDFNSIFYDKADFSMSQFLKESNFSGAIFHKESNFNRVKFSNKAQFRIARFRNKSRFIETQFSDKVDFTEVQFSDKADFTGAQFSNTADFSRAQLVGVHLVGFINNIILQGVNLTRAKYEISSSPSKGFVSGIKGLSTVSFRPGKQTGIVLLRAALKDEGLRELEREATYALKRTQRRHDWGKGFFKKIESIFNFILFEMTCAYGMEPGRPLLILVGLIPCFAIPYIRALRDRGTAGLWAVWLPDRVHKRPEEEQAVRVTNTHRLPKPWPWWTRAVLIGLYFSLLSTFRIGWRELNVGNWITRIQPREYTLQATGWVRVVSGIQSLISVYLLALWALTYFGRPFE